MLPTVGCDGPRLVACGGQVQWCSLVSASNSASVMSGRAPHSVIAQMTGSSYMVKASSYVASWNVCTVDRNVVESSANICRMLAQYATNHRGSCPVNVLAVHHCMAEAVPRTPWLG